MILARLSRAIRRQNWFAVVLEFMIVVAGVMLAFQVTAWNASREQADDARNVMAQLAADVELAEQLASRVLDLRIERVDLLISAWRQIEDPAVQTLETGECLAMAASHHFGVPIANLTAFDEVVASGRLHILEDAALRESLARYVQTTEALRRMLYLYPTSANNLTRDFPDLVRIWPSISDAGSGVGYQGECDLAAMRESGAFRNALTENIDLYDYFVATGLRPWRDALAEVRSSLAAAQGGMAE